MLDKYDILILKEFYKLKDKTCSSWEIMKNVYPHGREKEHNLMKKRILKMVGYGLFFINGDKKRTYILILDNVVFKKFSFPDGIKDGIALKLEGKWEIYQL